MIFYSIFFPVCLLSIVWSILNPNLYVGLFTALFTILYSGYGISVGFHRLISHRSFKTYNFVKYILVYLGCQAAQGTPVTWSLIHNRSHHRYTDKEGDIHTPTKGMWYAFIGWIFNRENHNASQKDLLRIRKTLDDFSVFCHKNYVFIVIFNLTLLGLGDSILLLSSLNASLLSVFISGFVNVFGHYKLKGSYTSFELDNNSVNTPWLVFLTWGESLHNNHHAYPNKASFSNKWYEFDFGHWFVKTIEKR